MLGRATARWTLRYVHGTAPGAGEQSLFIVQRAMDTARIASTARELKRRQESAKALVSWLLAATVIIGVSPPAQALMVGTTPSGNPNVSFPDTSMNPASYGSGWTQGDPGWANAVPTINFFNGIYIGDGWVLSAAHTAPYPYNPQNDGIKFEVGGTQYLAIPNQNKLISNPTGVAGLTNPTADLRLVRVETDVNLPSLSIASQPLGVNDEVVFIGSGVVRSGVESHYSVNTSTVPDTWTEVPSGGTYHGYVSNGAGKRWGTNRVENDQTVFGSSENDANITVNVSSRTIANVVRYDQGSGNDFELQAVGGDSGTGVFHKRNGQWELAGVVIANYIFDGQSYKYTGPPPRPPGAPPQDFNTSNTLAIYGNATAFADLSSYADQIEQIRSAPDINLDGVVSGDGTGPASSDDIAAFVAGWGYSNGLGYGTMTSWRQGDITGPFGTRDGKTDVYDFLRMRGKLTSPAAAAALSSFFDGVSVAGSGIPEPSTVMLIVGSAALLVLRGRWPRRPRLAA
jgi:hypothetical protein